MAGTKILVDTGPLVAFLSQTDQHHQWAVEAMAAIQEPLHTCEAVLSEAHFLLHSADLSSETLLQMWERGLLVVDFDMDDNRAELLGLLRKYANLPMSIADAGLVRMSEINERCQILTTDRDFLVYRRNGRGVIPVLTPF